MGFRPAGYVPVRGFGGDGASAVSTEGVPHMSHRNTPSKTKAASTKGAKQTGKAKNVTSEKTDGDRVYRVTRGRTAKSTSPQSISASPAE